MVLWSLSSIRLSASSVLTGLAAPKGLGLLLWGLSVEAAGGVSTVRGLRLRRGRSAGASLRPETYKVYQ